METSCNIFPSFGRNLSWNSSFPVNNCVFVAVQTWCLTKQHFHIPPDVSLGHSLRQFAPLLLSSRVYIAVCLWRLIYWRLTTGGWCPSVFLRDWPGSGGKSRLRWSLHPELNCRSRWNYVFLCCGAGIWLWQGSLNRFCMMLLTSHIKPFFRSFFFITTETSQLRQLHVNNYRIKCWRHPEKLCLDHPCPTALVLISQFFKNGTKVKNTN